MQLSSLKWYHYIILFAYLLQTTHHFSEVYLWGSQHSWIPLLVSAVQQFYCYWRVLLMSHSEDENTLMQWKEGYVNPVQLLLLIEQLTRNWWSFCDLVNTGKPLMVAGILGDNTQGWKVVKNEQWNCEICRLPLSWEHYSMIYHQARKGFFNFPNLQLIIYFWNACMCFIAEIQNW